jgi:paraquat-inducible protein B
MKTKVSPTIVGAFVLGAFVLGFVALLAFGGVSFFSKPQRFVVYFDESIHGLDLGSPVKLRGVRLGRVVDLNIHYDAARNQSVVAVVCELSRNMITDAKGAQLDVSSRDELQRLVDHGLRAQLGVLGLATGLLFVELDFVDPHLYPAPPRAASTKNVVVPSMPSAISEFQANLTEILNDVKKIDFAGLSIEFKGLLTDTRRQLAGVDLKGAVDQWKKTGAQVEALATQPELKDLIVNLNAAITELRGTLAKVDTQVGTNGDELRATLAQAKQTLETFNAAAASLHKFIASQSGVGDDAARALNELAAAADSVRRLADFLERNPQALLSGRPRPE